MATQRRKTASAAEEGSAVKERLSATIRDVSAYSAGTKNLAIYFSPADRHLLPREDGGRLTLEFPGRSYEATIGRKTTNPPYLRSTLYGPEGKTNCTKVLFDLGCDHGDAIRFEVYRKRRVLRFLKRLPGEGPPPRPGSMRVTGARKLAREPKTQSRKPLPKSIQLEKLDRMSVLSWEKEYWSHINPDDARKERQFERQFLDARQKGYLTKTLFEDVAKWKSRQRLDLIRGNSPGSVKRYTRMAFKARDRSDAILALKNLDGVALRRAVAFLHWMLARVLWSSLRLRVPQSLLFAQSRGGYSLRHGLCSASMPAVAPEASECA